MSFLRHGEIYPCDEGAISRPRPRSSPWMSLQLVIPGRLLSSSEIPDRWSGQTGKEQASSRRIRYAESGLSVGS
jgi:hypothetical protein